jgi:ribonucleoside-diphosphate reductase alpha chain
MGKASSALLTGGGIGVDYSAIRYKGAPIKRTGGFCTGPVSLMEMVNEAGRHVMQGGQRRSAIWAGLQWDHKDIPEFIHVKDYSPELKTMKEKDFNFRLPMEYTNISVVYDTNFFIAIENPEHPDHAKAMKIWMDNCLQAFSTAEPGMAFNFMRDAESLRNACTEVVSEDDSDKCNLGTVWMNRCKDKEEFADVCIYGTYFLMCGGIYSDVPTDKIKEVGLKNNRIGLGLGGMHEWLMVRGHKYQCVPELHKWLATYERESDSAAYVMAKQLGVAIPKGVRAIAPTGTIGILAETTTGIEPLFCKAYKRRYLNEKQEWVYQYVVDGAVKRLLEQGVKIEAIQDSYDISFKERVKFQADVQQYVDMAISSTCNMPSWGSEDNNEKTLERNAMVLLKYAKRLRGFTVYPDGCRGGQPLTRADLDEALANEGMIFEEKEQECLNGVCGI